MTTLEQTIENISTWSPTDRRQLQAWLQEKERQDEVTTLSGVAVEQPTNGARPAVTALRSTETVEEQLARYRRAKNWIKEHRAEYLNQWVVLEGDQLISHGFDGHRVCDEASAAGIKVPFLVWLNEEPAAFMTGLL